jgi:DNA topoisomerase-3
MPPAVAKELIARGKTEKPVTGFKGRSGRSFRARLALVQNEEGRWRVEFDEPWAKEGLKAPGAEDEAVAETAEPATAAAGGDASAAA